VSSRQSQGPTIVPEETIHSESIYRGRIIQVRVDTVQTPAGSTTREIVEHAPVVAMVALDADGNLLLVRQYRKAVEDVLLEIPAGGIEPGESREDAVRREMVEETGLEPRHIEPLCTLYPSPGMSDEVMYVYLVTDLVGDGIPTEATDQLSVMRVARAEALALIHTGRIVDAKSVAGVLMLESRSLHNESSRRGERTPWR